MSPLKPIALPSPAAAEGALNTTVYARVRERLRGDIVAGIWPLGARMTMAELQRRYEVSAIPIREALQELRGEGLVEILGHRGARVPFVDAKFIADSYDMRAGIRSVLARRSAERIGPRDLAALAEAEGDFEGAVHRADVPAMLDANRRFHGLLDQVADNQQALKALTRGPTSLIDAVRLHHGYGPARLDEVVREHRAMLEAMRSHDGEAAARLMYEHAMGAKRDLLARMDKAVAA